MHGILAVIVDVSAGVQAPSIYAVISREAVQSILSLFFSSCRHTQVSLVVHVQLENNPLR
jgi:hypothetical protein